MAPFDKLRMNGIIITVIAENSNRETLKKFPLPTAGEGQGEGATRKSLLFTLT
jgi:hypothetical protein